MKKRKLNTKLLLKKETIADMGNEEMKVVRGGVGYFDYTGITCMTRVECTHPYFCELTYQCPTYQC